MVRFYSLFLALFFIASCAAKATPVDYHGYSPHSPQGKYYELMSFKDSPDFFERGFAKGTPYHYWREFCETKRRSDSVDPEVQDKYRVLLMLATSYYQNKGKETPLTRTLSHMALQNTVTKMVPAPPIVKK